MTDDTMERLKETAERRGMTVEALVAEIAQGIVDRWESIPETVARFRARFPETTDGGIRAYEDSLRECAGGEEIYLASLRFLEGRG